MSVSLFYHLLVFQFNSISSNIKENITIKIDLYQMFDVAHMCVLFINIIFTISQYSFFSSSSS